MSYNIDPAFMPSKVCENPGCNAETAHTSDGTPRPYCEHCSTCISHGIHKDCRKTTGMRAEGGHHLLCTNCRNKGPPSCPECTTPCTGDIHARKWFYYCKSCAHNKGLNAPQCPYYEECGGSRNLDLHTGNFHPLCGKCWKEGKDPNPTFETVEETPQDVVVETSNNWPDLPSKVLDPALSFSNSQTSETHQKLKLSSPPFTVGYSVYIQRIIQYLHRLDINELESLSDKLEKKIQLDEDFDKFVSEHSDESREDLYNVMDEAEKDHQLYVRCVDEIDKDAIYV